MASEVFVPSEYSTIQEGIDAVDPDGTVHVAAGLYTATSTILVEKSVTILGAQADVDPRPNCFTTRTPGDTTTEAIVDGTNTLSTIFRIQADDVTINGLEVKNGRGDLIDSLAVAPVKQRPQVIYNIIHQATLDEGIQLRNIVDGVISYNRVFNTFGDGINICCNSLNNNISFNEVHDIHSPDAAIYVYESENTTIEMNLVYNVTVNDGIKLGDADGADENRSGGIIRNNIVHDVIEDGITVKTSDTIVEGNEIYNSQSRNGALFLDQMIDNISIKHNCIHDNGVLGDGRTTYGVRIGIDNEFPSNVTVNFNNIFNNVDGGIIYNSMNNSLLDAEENWWGSPEGPNTVEGDTVVGNVDYDPWLTSPAAVCNPNITCPDDITVETDIGECIATVSYKVTATSNDCGITEINCNGQTKTFSPPKQTVTFTETQTFEVGCTEVTCTATNASGDSDECSFTVTVIDTEPPSITCSNDMIVKVGPGETGAMVAYPEPIVSDNCSDTTYSCRPESGNFFPIGTTTVTCTAVDSSGNVSSCSFNISVEEQQLTLLLDLTILYSVQAQADAMVNIPFINELIDRPLNNKSKNDLTSTHSIRVSRVYDWVVFCCDYQRRINVPSECNSQIIKYRNEGCNITVSCQEVSEARSFTILEEINPNFEIQGMRIFRIKISLVLHIQYICNDSPICDFETPVSMVEELILYSPVGTTIATEILDLACKVIEVRT